MVRMLFCKCQLFELCKNDVFFNEINIVVYSIYINILSVTHYVMKIHFMSKYLHIAINH